MSSNDQCGVRQEGRKEPICCSSVFFLVKLGVVAKEERIGQELYLKPCPDAV